MAKTSHLTRRNFLKATGIAAGAAAIGGSALTAVAAESKDNKHGHKAAASASNEARMFRGRMFFTNDLEFSTLSGAAERIFPRDETGPGAIDLAVPYFIDNQLAGAYGYNEREYSMGPFSKGAPTQGYQTALRRNDLVRQGLIALNAQAKNDYAREFPRLSDAEKDQILKKCEAGDIPTQGFTSSEFFVLLRTMVLAGAYADPIYAGNNNMDGWRMKDYPGAQMSYLDVVSSRTFEKVDPMSLADMQ